MLDATLLDLGLVPLKKNGNELISWLLPPQGSLTGEGERVSPCLIEGSWWITFSCRRVISII